MQLYGLFSAIHICYIKSHIVVLLNFHVVFKLILSRKSLILSDSQSMSTNKDLCRFNLTCQCIFLHKKEDIEKMFIKISSISSSSSSISLNLYSFQESLVKLGNTHLSWTRFLIRLSHSESIYPPCHTNTLLKITVKFYPNTNRCQGKQYNTNSTYLIYFMLLGGYSELGEN